MISVSTRGLHIALALLLLTGTATAERMTASAFQSALDAVTGYAIAEGEHPFTEELQAIDKAVIASQGDEALRAAHADALANFLASDDTGADAKWFAARQLQRIAGPGQVETIAPLLTHADTTDIAIYALQDIPGEEATQALLHALDATVGPVRVGIINAIAARGDAAALPALDELALLLPAAGAEVYTDAEWAEVEAALNAIAAIGGEQAETILRDRLTGIGADPNAAAAPRPLFLPYYHAWLRFLTANDRIEALDPLSDLGPIARLRTPTQVQLALGGIIMKYQPRMLQQPVDALQSDEFSDQAKRSMLWLVEEPSFLQQLATDLPNLPWRYQALALEALAERQVTEAAPGAAQLAGSTVADIRIAALLALGRVGNEEHIELLLNNATSATPEFVRAAAQALARLQGDGINDAIVRQMQQSGASVRQAGIEALVARRALDAMDAIWSGTTDSNSQVRVAAFNALATLGDEDTALRLARSVVDAPDNDTREAAASAMVRVAQRTGTQGEVAREALNHLQQGDIDALSYATAVSALGRLDDPAALPVLVDAVRSPVAPVQMAGIRALNDWPTAAPLNDLIELATTLDDPAVRTLTVRSAISVVDKLPSVDEQLAAYRRILTLDLASQETRRVLAGLAKLTGSDALALAESFLEDDDLRADAEFAIARIRANSAAPSASLNSDDAALAMDSDSATRWTTGQLQHPGQWFQLAFAEPTTLAGIVLNASQSPQDYPRGYAVYISDDGETWGEPIATGAGTEGVTRIEFELVTTQAIRIEQTSTADDNFWSIHTLELVTNE